MPDVAVTLPGQDEIKISLSRWRMPCWTLAGWAPGPSWNISKWQDIVTIPAGDRPGPMVAADLSRDGGLDFVVGDYGSNKVSVLTKTWPLRSGAAFQPYVESDQGTGAEFARLALGDLNNDGSVDVVSTLSSLLGNFDGTFATPAAHAASDDQTLADVNGDGILDLVSVDTAANQVSVALGVGNGLFAAPTSFATGVGPVRVLVADVNGDGKPDIVTANSSGSVSVLLGNSAGSFDAHVDTTVGASPLGIAAGDVNRDGKLDLVVANSGDSTVSVLLGDGAGGFTRSDVTVGAQPEAVGLGDFNRDGKLDLVVGTAAGNVSVLPGDGTGGFGTAVTAASPAGATELAVGDFTTDGKLDVVAAAPHGSGTADASLLAGNGAGGFTTPATALNLTVPGDIVTGLASADFNHDGVPDLIVGGKDPSNPALGRLYLFLNDTYAPYTECPHDARRHLQRRQRHGRHRDGDGGGWVSHLDRRHEPRLGVHLATGRHPHGRRRRRRGRPGDGGRRQGDRDHRHGSRFQLRVPADRHHRHGRPGDGRERQGRLDPDGRRRHGLPLRRLQRRRRQ